MALGRIHQIISARGEGGLVPRRFEVALDGGDDVFVRPIDLLAGEDRRFHRPVGDRLEDLQGHRPIDPHPADPDAQRRADVSVVAAALVAMGV
ncbi:MAG: hypothetical protein JO303_00725, partial [Caulobacteraceae bacterium]|nr:hypothetical protein [Caulobacteraceae bacterium]